MNQVKLTINDTEVLAEPRKTILEAARSADIYIPALCTHPELPPVDNIKGAKFVFRGDKRIESENPATTWDGCGLCVVQVNGQLIRACATEVAEGMAIITDSNKILAHRGEKLFNILDKHPHACLTCAQAEGCPRTQCSSNVPEEERCCELLGFCELQKVSNFVGVPKNLPRYKPLGLPTFDDEALFNYNPDLCIGCLRCVRACHDLRGVGTLFFVLRDGRPVVGTAEAPTHAESHCRFCGACVEVCPTGALMDKARAVGEERANRLVPCRNTCPAGIDIPLFIRYIAKGEAEKAFWLIKEKVPLIFSASYVCFHPCEEECRRGDINSPLSICRLKRFSTENNFYERHSLEKQVPATGKRVAVVGSGPAGLTASYYLAKKGRQVTVFEMLSESGGMLRVGIPEYRFPLELLKRDIKEIESAGVSIKCNSAIDKSGLEKLVSEYEAVFIATGAHLPKRIKVPGSNLAGVYWGVEFLRERALGKIQADVFKGLNVLVVGGGNVAIDSARIALRLGSTNVSIVCLESPGELPAWDWEVKEAEEEGISFFTGWGPLEIIGQDGLVKSLEVKRCTSVFDEKGRFNPAYDENETRRFSTEAVILAIGQEPSSEPFAACGRRSNNTIEINQKNLLTKMDKVYAGGDVTSGPASVIEAIAMGRKAAAEIDKALGGDGDIAEKFVEPEPIDQYLGKVEHFARLKRRIPIIKNTLERSTSFCAIEETFTEKDAIAEARRCLSCDLRLEIQGVTLPPPTESIFALAPEVVAGFPEVAGVYQLLDDEKKVIDIKGVMNLKTALSEVLAENEKASFFIFEAEPMYTKRESELIQQYLQEHGELPGGGDDDLDDLFF